MGKLGIISLVILIFAICFIGYLFYLYSHKKEAIKGNNSEETNPFHEDLELIKKANNKPSLTASTDIDSSEKKIQDFEVAYERYNKKNRFFDTDEKEIEQVKKEDPIVVESKNTLQRIEKDGKVKVEEKETLEEKVSRYQNKILETINFIKEQRDK